MRVRIRNRTWDLVTRSGMKGRGDCEGPHVRNKKIRISSRLKGEHRLEIILHECLHAAFWDLDEEVIEQVGRDLARVLWRLGYREVTDGEEETQA